MELDGEGGDGAVGGVGECCRRHCCCCCTITKRIRTAPNPSPIAQACTPTPKPKHDGFLEQHVLPPANHPPRLFISPHTAAPDQSRQFCGLLPICTKSPQGSRRIIRPCPYQYIWAVFSHRRPAADNDASVRVSPQQPVLINYYSRADQISLSRTITSPHAAHQQKHLCFVFSPPALKPPKLTPYRLIMLGGEKMEEGSRGEKEPLYLLLPWLYNYAESMWRGSVCEFLRLQKESAAAPLAQTQFYLLNKESEKTWTDRQVAQNKRRKTSCAF